MTLIVTEGFLVLARNTGRNREESEGGERGHASETQQIQLSPSYFRITSFLLASPPARRENVLSRGFRGPESLREPGKSLDQPARRRTLARHFSLLSFALSLSLLLSLGKVTILRISRERNCCGTIFSGASFSLSRLTGCRESYIYTVIFLP